MTFYTTEAREARRANPPFTHDRPLGPGEQARLVENYRLSLAAEARHWLAARRAKQQAGIVTARADLRAWRASQ